jgi:hypothetical protein
MWPPTQPGSAVLEPSPAACPELKPAPCAGAASPRPEPLITVIVLNYNGAAWLDRCLTSLAAQTIAGEVEIIVADNASTDHSELLAADLMQPRPDWRVIRHGKNFGYCEGNNLAVRHARGRYLMFLNTDTWLEPDCLERLAGEVRAAGAVAATPLVTGYRDDEMQSAGEAGFDPFGLVCGPTQWSHRQEIFVATGPSLFVESKWFQTVGGFDAQFFMYADEYDLCWRLWLAGGKVILAPSARLHHRGAVAANPKGGEQIEENRTSDTKRFYANRNTLLVLLKNAQHLLLLLVPLQVALLGAEALAAWAVTRRWSHVRRAYVGALWDCWRLRRHIAAERRRLRGLRRRGDFWMLRFLRARLNRWRELRRVLALGLPKFDKK